MFRKLLYCEVRSAACRFWPNFSMSECVKNTERTNMKHSFLSNSSELSSCRLLCETNLYQRYLNLGEIKSRRKISHMQYTSRQSLDFKSEFADTSEILGSTYFSPRCSKSTRNISNVLKPVLLESASRFVMLPGGIAPSVRFMATGKDGFSSIRNRISSLHAKKRTPKKKKTAMDSDENEETVEGFSPVARHKFLTFDPDFTLPEIQAHRPPHRDWQVIAYATADEYDLDALLKGLTQQGLYTAAAINPGNTANENPAHITSSKAVKNSTQHAHNSNTLKSQIFLQPATNSSSHNSNASAAVPDAHDVLHMVATYQVGSENREIYFFREGSVVFWNVAELECSNVLQFLKKFEQGSYKNDTIEEESESITYTYSDTPSKTRLIHNRIFLNPEGPTDLEKYTFSNAMAISVKLGIWEASLDKYIDDIEYVSEELSKTGRVVLSQDQVLQCMGQLCALRHLINLSSDLLDIPDFYWEHETLEQLYQKTANYLNVSKRTSVMNVKLSHCVELMDLLKSHLNEQHSARLEWIIIILIMIEVGFELLHVLERWL